MPEVPHFVLEEVFRFLSLKDLLNVSLVCKRWKEAANSNGVWQALCLQFWSTKVYVRPNSNSINWKDKYISSLENSKNTVIARRELCAFDWRFR